MHIKFPSYNSKVDLISRDMTDNNEAVLMGISPGDTRHWFIIGSVSHMGYTPRGDNAPAWWNPTNTSFKALIPWEAVTPWFETMNGVDHQATNTLVNISNITLQLFDVSVGAWRKVPTVNNGNIIWCKNHDNSNGTIVSLADSTKRIETNGSWSIRTQLNLGAHGGSDKYLLSDMMPDITNIKGLFVKMEAKLVLDNPNGVDDRDKAQILISVGADFWPKITTTIGDLAPTGYAPTTSICRWVNVNIKPRDYHSVTINPPPLADPTISPWVVAGNITLMPRATFDAALPPYINTLSAK